MQKTRTIPSIITSVAALFLISVTGAGIVNSSDSGKGVSVKHSDRSSNEHFSDSEADDPYVKRNKEIQTILENAITNQQAEDKYDDLRQSPYLSDVIAAIASNDPDEGIALYRNIDTLYRGENLTGFKAWAASTLARVLKGSKRKQLLDACAEEKDVASNVAASVRVFSIEDLEAVASLVDPTSAYGSLILTITAGELKDSGQDWKKALQMAGPPKNGDTASDPAVIAGQVFGSYLIDDLNPLKGELQRLSESENQRQWGISIAGITAPLKIMLTRKIEGKADHRIRYANSICEASKIMRSDKAAFSVLSFAAEALGERLPDCITTELKRRWHKSHLDGKVTGIYYAVFYAFNHMLDVDAQWATMVAEELVSSLLSQENYGSYYHMIGTVAGIIAGGNKDLAKDFAMQIRSLEWHFHAQRCIYREWAKVDPEAALSAAKESFASSGMDAKTVNRMQKDLTLEAAVGASIINPELAADEIAVLPAKRIRFTQGSCLIAPSLARVDLDRALRLLETSSRGAMNTDAAAALAHILLDRLKVDLDPATPDFYPDYIRPRNLWPGPRVSQPLRF